MPLHSVNLRQRVFLFVSHHCRVIYTNSFSFFFFIIFMSFYYFSNDTKICISPCTSEGRAFYYCAAVSFRLLKTVAAKWNNVPMILQLTRLRAMSYACTEYRHYELYIYIFTILEISENQRTNRSDGQHVDLWLNIFMHT